MQDTNLPRYQPALSVRGYIPIFAVIGTTKAVVRCKENHGGEAIPGVHIARGFIAVQHVFASRRGLFVLALSIFTPAFGAAAQDMPKDMPKDMPIILVPHRAIYDLSLSDTRGNSQVASVRGRILYDFSGSACKGYSLEFRQVSELDSGEGKVSTSDLRSTTWEDAKAKSFKFTSENFVDENLVDTGDAHAERGATATAVDLS